jgi:hypothetical protein
MEFIEQLKYLLDALKVLEKDFVENQHEIHWLEKRIKDLVHDEMQNARLINH